MRLFLNVLLSFLVTITNPTIANGCLEAERDALLTFKAGLHDPGKLLSSWHGPNCCNWSGVTCDNITDHVVTLNLRNLYDCDDYYSCSNWESPILSGEINPSLLSLRHLTYFDISGHNFSNCSIPKFIGSFENLVYLNLSFSNFQGVIPHEIGNLSRLQFLDLSESNFTGLIPPQLGNLSDLRYLSFPNSYFYQSSKPASDSLSWFSRLSNLKYLDISVVDLDNKIDWSVINEMRLLETLMLSDCSLSEIPTDLSHVKLTSLTKLDLSDNSFNSILPNWLWNLTSLLYVDLSGSNFHGSIPHTLSNLVSLNYLSLASNDLSGNIYSWIAQMTNLSIIDLSNNALSGHIPNGTIPSRICDMHFLRVLDLSRNALSGEIPDCWKNISKLEYIDLSNNQITGELPPSIGSLQYLIILQLYNNKFSGEIPLNLQRCKNLVFLSLGRNNFSGTIPAWIGKQLQNLVVFSLQSNKFTGCIPLEIGELTRLQILDLANNSLIGFIPTSVGNFSSMKNSSYYSSTSGRGGSWYYAPGDYLYENVLYIDISGRMYTAMSLEYAQIIDFSRNNLNGQIPEEICLLQAITNLNLSENFLIGDIPKAINYMLSLESLDLSFNKFSGLIPQNLPTLSLLYNLNLSYNNFSGRIPTGWQRDILNDPSIYAGNFYLCGPPTDRICSKDQPPVADYVHGENESGMETVWFYLSIAIGFIFGYWSFFGVLIFQNVWRIAFFQRIDNNFDKMYVQIALAMRRRIGSNA